VTNDPKKRPAIKTGLEGDRSTSLHGASVNDFEHRSTLPALPCEDCGSLSPEDAIGDLAVHDCDKNEWLVITLTIPSAQ
jgi:hypothetical protein